MKKYLLSFLFLTGVITAHAQLDYTLTHGNSTYTELSAGTDISVNAWNSMHTMNLPFSFTFFNQNYNKIYITFDGFFFSDTGDDYIFYGTDNFMPENGIPALSPITYEVSGNSPDRIFKVQWKNVKEMTVDTSSHEYTINNQIWLYENGSKIEYRFGPNVINDPNFDRFYIGIIDYDNSPYLAIDSSASSPVLVRVTNAGIFNGIPAYPNNGQVYTLTPVAPTAVISQIKPYRLTGRDNVFEVYHEGHVSCSITDLSGRTTGREASNGQGSAVLDLRDLTPGLYLLNIQLSGAVFTEKIVIR